MSINVYWSCIEEEWLRAFPPEPVYENFLKNKNFENTAIHRCPAFTGSLKNVFALKSLYTYEFGVDSKSATSRVYDQTFFDRHVLVRSLPERTFSFQQYFTFFVEEPSLEMTGNMQPFLEKNNINERCLVFPGKFNIGKWFRNIEFSFHLKNNYDSFKIDEGEIYSYVQFHTNEKINFIQYKHSFELVQMLKDIMQVRQYSSKTRNLMSYYKMFKTKKFIINEIKKNIV